MFTSTKHQKIQLLKEGNNPAKLYYENDDIAMQKKISMDEYDKLFKFIQPNFSFSLPDRLIFDMIKDGRTYPSFKNSMEFTKDDLDEIINPLDKSILELFNKKKKKVMNNFTQKKKQNKNKKKVEILNKITKYKKFKLNKSRKKNKNKNKNKNK